MSIYICGVRRSIGVGERCQLVWNDPHRQGHRAVVDENLTLHWAVDPEELRLHQALMKLFHLFNDADYVDYTTHCGLGWEEQSKIDDAGDLIEELLLARGKQLGSDHGIKV